MASGGKAEPNYPEPLSIQGQGVNGSSRSINNAVTEVTLRYKHLQEAIVIFPTNDSGVYTIRAAQVTTVYDRDYYYFDQHTFTEMPVAYFGKYKDADAGETLNRMNYDIHVGSIAGLPGRVAMFFGALLGASLPVTGFYIWWGKRKKVTLVRKNKKHRIAISTG